MDEVRKLRIYYFVLIALAVGMVVCFETDMLAEGPFCGVNAQAEFVVTVLMEILSICIIPITLRFVRRVVWRVSLIMVPMVANTLLYYLFMSVPFGYLAIILLIVSVFVYPKKKVAR